MRAPKPITLTQTDASEHTSRLKPKPFVVVGDMPGGGEDPGPTAWDDITGKPTTFPPVVGTTATTAKAGDYAPDWGDVTGKPATFAPTIGSTATTALAGNTTIPPAATWANLSGKPATFPPTVGTTAATAKAGDYQPTWAQVSGKPTTFPPATHDHTIAQITGLQVIITDLTDRIEALEAAAA